MNIRQLYLNTRGTTALNPVFFIVLQQMSKHAANAFESNGEESLKQASLAQN